MDLQILICDIDNCISDDRHRMPYCPAAARHYMHHTSALYASPLPLHELADEHFHDYHVRLPMDTPANLGILADHMRVDSRDVILFVTAMPYRYALLRRWWLQQYLPRQTYIWSRLLCRANGDRRSAPEVKVDLVRYALETEPEYAIVVKAIDDRQDVLDAYNEHFDFPTERVYINE